MGATRDLFGDPLPREKRQRVRKARSAGYASRPGSGPRGQRCNTCALCVRVNVNGVHSHRCEILAAKWRDTPGMDISPGAPACKDWQRKDWKKHYQDREGVS